MEPAIRETAAAHEAPQARPKLFVERRATARGSGGLARAARRSRRRTVVAMLAASAVTAVAALVATDPVTGVAVALALTAAGLLAGAVRLRRESERVQQLARSAEARRDLVERDAAGAARRAALAIATAALDATDPDTLEHSEDVVLLCDALAERLGIVDSERDHLLVAARLHDIGKLAVPREILTKPGPLDEDEWEVMRRHTLTGEQIVGAVPELEPVAPLVRSAHERYDGNGYPDGLAGEAIPLGSRVILCADAFHAIRSDRPYRRARSARDAVEEIERNAGSQFDPLVAAALIDTVREAGGPARGAGLLAAARSPRLLALLGALAVGGTAVAAVPPLRHAVQRLVGDRPAQEVRQLPPAARTPSSCAELALAGTPCRASAFDVLARARRAVGSHPGAERGLPVASGIRPRGSKTTAAPGRTASPAAQRSPATLPAPPGDRSTTARRPHSDNRGGRRPAPGGRPTNGGAGRGRQDGASGARPPSKPGRAPSAAGGGGLGKPEPGNPPAAAGGPGEPPAPAGSSGEPPARPAPAPAGPGDAAAPNPGAPAGKKQALPPAGPGSG